MNKKNTLIIAEIGLNWFGDIDLAKELISLAKKAGADIAKFQLYRPRELLGENSPYLKDAELGVPSKDQARELKKWADQENIEWCASVFHPDLIEFTEELGVKRYKVASRSIGDLPLLKAINETKKPVILSRNMSWDDNDYNAIRILRDCPDVSVMYCVSDYPTSLDSVSLGYMGTIYDRISGIRSVKTGFSSHCPYIEPTIAAVALGASVVENHIVKNREVVGCDVSSSLTIEEYTNMVRMIRNMEKMLW